MNNNYIEKHLEMVRLTGTTPEEVAKEYADLITSKWSHPEVRYSMRHKEMMIYAPSCSAPREINGVWFAEIEYDLWNNPVDKEDDE